MRELPSILDVARRYGVEINESTLDRAEVRAKCPFCRADANRPRKYYLSLNPAKNVFRCWFCGEAGGVVRFEALLSGRTEAAVMEAYGLGRKDRHPAERLTARQLRIAGYVARPDWELVRERGEIYARRVLGTIERRWNATVRAEIRKAEELLRLATETGQTEEAIRIIRARSQEIGVDLLAAAKSFIGEGRKGAAR